MQIKCINTSATRRMAFLTDASVVIYIDRIADLVIILIKE